MPAGKPRSKRQAYGLPADQVAFLKSTQDVQLILAHGVNQDGSLKPQTIRALLKFKGLDVKPMAETAGYHDTYFHQVIDRTRHDVTVEDVIAAGLGMDPERLWGRRPADVKSA